jgi:hypothetical protein
VARGSFGGRLGLVWESSPLVRDKRTYVVRVVQKGTRIRESLLWSLLSSAPVPISVVAFVVVIPIRALMLLIYRDSFKVALLEVDAYPEEERILERHAVRGEKEALALARRMHNERGSRAKEPGRG